MLADTFNKLVSHRVFECTNLLIPKSQEYCRDGDRLHNFKRAGQILNQTPETALVGMYVKHLTSVLDIVSDLDSGKMPTPMMLAEKVNDSINYLLLLEALICERRTAQDRCASCGVNYADDAHEPICAFVD